MRNGTQPSRRAGFTLIELLIVISILAMLAALTLAGISRVRSGQYAATTESTVKKLQVALAQNRTAVIDEATSDKNPYLQYVLPWCDGDRDRAKAVLAYLYMKREFPQTFAEARNGITIPGVLVIPPHKAFADIPAGTFTAEQEASVLLNKIVTGKANRGTTVDADGAFSGATFVVPGPNAPGFKDGYGNYIIYQRFATSTDIDSPPYTRAAGGQNDPLDPTGKLRFWRLPNGTPHSNVAWLINNVLNANLPTTLQLPANAFDGRNRVLTVISAGPDQNKDSSGNVWWASHPDGWLGGDNVFGFRLAQFGGKNN